MSKKSITFLAAVRDCGPYLPRIFNQIDSVRSHYQVNCVFVYDNCTDNSSNLLHEYKKKHFHTVEVFELKNNNSSIRTVRIANARNKALSIFENRFAKISPFFIMFDPDNVNAGKKWNMKVLQYYLEEEEDWDAISFNRSPYYDIWALMIPPYLYHCWGFGNNSKNIIHFMKFFMTMKLKKNPKYTSIEVWSAFNGFGIYKTDKFKGIRYDGTLSQFMKEKFLSKKDMENTLIAYRKALKNPNLNFKNAGNDHCEHLFYHLSAKRKNNVKIKVSTFVL